MTEAKNDGLSIVVFKDGDMYVAQCVEHDICAQAADVKTLRHRMDAAIDAERDYARSRGKTLADTVAPAPKHFADMFEKAWGAKQENDSMRLALCA